MNKTTPNITEEHIVAWLDGELTPGADFERSIAANAELASAVAEFAALDAAFGRSRTDTRFALPKAVDSRVRASLATEISRSRKTVRMPERAPLAAPIPSTTTVIRTKNLWARRASYAMALVLMGVFGWFVGHTGETTTNETALNAPATSTTTSQTVTAPNASHDADISNSVATTAPVSTEQAAATSPVHSAPSLHQQDRMNTQVGTTPATQVAQSVTTPKPATPAAEENDPAAIMASHRYAKLIKATQAVVITAQDQM